MLVDAALRRCTLLGTVLYRSAPSHGGGRLWMPNVASRCSTPIYAGRTCFGPLSAALQCFTVLNASLRSSTSLNATLRRTALLRTALCCPSLLYATQGSPKPVYARLRCSTPPKAAPSRAALLNTARCCSIPLYASQGPSTASLYAVLHCSTQPNIPLRHQTRLYDVFPYSGFSKLMN